jgi:hypothetical protein
MDWFTDRKAPKVGWFDALADPEVYEERGRLRTGSLSGYRDVTDEVTAIYGRETANSAITYGQRQRRGFRFW